MTGPSPTPTQTIREVNEATTAAIIRAWDGVITILHTPYTATLDRPALREHRRHCRRCRSLPGYPKPLKVNGADYQRRRNNRRKRK